MAVSGIHRLSGLHPEVDDAARWALTWAETYGVPVTVTSGYRSIEDQARLYRRFRACVEAGRFPSRECPYPANPPGGSSHNFGLAFDSTTEPRFQEWWNYVRRLAGFEVLPNDIIHAQVPNWRSHV